MLKNIALFVKRVVMIKRHHILSPYMAENKELPARQPA